MLRPDKDHRYAIVLLLAAAVLLAIGLALRPGRPQPKPEIDMARLQQLTQQRRLVDLSSYLTNAAQSVASSIVYFDAVERSGIVWDSRLIIAPALVVEGQTPRAATDPNGARMPLTRARAVEGVPFVVLQDSSSAVVPAFRAAAPPHLGEWVLAVAKNRDNAVVFSHGIYQGRINSRCGSFPYDAVQSNASISAGLVGGGLFTLEGALLGYIAECDHRPIVISEATITAFLQKPQTVNERLETEYGFRVGELASSAETPTAPSPAVQVITVWAHSAADAAHLQPGDLIAQVDGDPVKTPADLQRFAEDPATPHVCRVLRGRSYTDVTFTPVEAPKHAPISTPVGLTVGPGANDRQVMVKEVASASAAQRAGILEGDILQSIGNKPVSDYAAAAALLSQLGQQSTVLMLERDGKELEVLIAP